MTTDELTRAIADELNRIVGQSIDEVDQGELCDRVVAKVRDLLPLDVEITSQQTSHDRITFTVEGPHRLMYEWGLVDDPPPPPKPIEFTISVDKDTP